jgi:DNA repair protein RecN (Recombination protein N)
MHSKAAGMLRFLRIRDFALIRHLEIEFEEGLTVLTGETGSGKSILVDAFGLLIGSRSSPEMVRAGCESAVVEGAFSIENADWTDLLGEAGIECPDDSLLIRREISSAGRGRVFINNSLATVTLLKSLGSALADIHGQQDHQSLLDLSTHLKWLDRFGGNPSAVEELRSQYRQLRDLTRQLEAIALDEQERQRFLDILRFQVDEIHGARIRPGEKEELENERSLLTNREKVFALANEVLNLLNESDTALTGQLSRLIRLVQQLGNFDSSWLPHKEGLQESLYRLEELVLVARGYSSGIDFTPGRLDQVESRLQDLDRLFMKYGKSAEEVLAFADRSESRLQELQSANDITHRLKDEIERGLKKYLAMAENLSIQRRKVAARLEREIRSEFKALAMEKMDLNVRFRPFDATATLAGTLPAYCGPEGVDQVEFLIAPNPGEEMRPLSRIASGGELSRIMLAIRTLCGGGERDRALVFDEIDAGIGGRVAEIVGKRLRAISGQNQVLCVTHLPQIAAYARNHIRVYKDTAANRTEARIQCLKRDDRVEELARMMGGEFITDTARRHATEMLAHALPA